MRLATIFLAAAIAVPGLGGTGLAGSGPAPAPDAQPAEPPASDLSGICFLVDRSRNMEAAAKPARAELVRIVRELRNDEIFNVVLFGDGKAEPLSPRMMQATDENKELVAKRAEAMTCSGLPAPTAALLQAMALKPEAICLVTAGPFSDAAAEFISRRNAGKIRISVVGVLDSADAGSKAALAKLAKRNRGRLLALDPALAAAPPARQAPPRPSDPARPTKPAEAPARDKCLSCGVAIDKGDEYCFTCELAGKRYATKK
jgi:hypothetical protein